MWEAPCTRASRLSPAPGARCGALQLANRARAPRSVLVRRDPVGAVHRAGALAGEDAHAGAAPPCSTCGRVAGARARAMHAPRVWLERRGRWRTAQALVMHSCCLPLYFYVGAAALVAALMWERMAG